MENTTVPVELFSPEELQVQLDWLKHRRKDKQRIIREGGIRAEIHSQADITRIDYAIRRIEEGQYGICTNCGSIIERERLLKYQPETPFCASCAHEKAAR